MNGLLEKLRRGAIRALSGYVEQVPPPKPQDTLLIKSESRRVEKITGKEPHLLQRARWRPHQTMGDAAHKRGPC